MDIGELHGGRRSVRLSELQFGAEARTGASQGFACFPVAGMPCVQLTNVHLVLSGHDKLRSTKTKVTSGGNAPRYYNDAFLDRTKSY